MDYIIPPLFAFRRVHETDVSSSRLGSAGVGEHSGSVLDSPARSGTGGKRRWPTATNPARLDEWRRSATTHTTGLDERWWPTAAYPTRMVGIVGLG